MNKKLMEAKFHYMNQGFKAHYQLDGNFTVCVLTTPSNDIASVGIAKCNPNYDAFDHVRGRDIAFLRAVKKLMNNGQ